MTFFLQNKKTPFRRVQTEAIDVDHRLKDNSFEAKVNNQQSVRTVHIYL